MPGANDGADGGRSFLERMRVPARVQAAAPAGMRSDTRQRGSRRKKSQRPSVSQILVFAVMAFLAIALGLSTFIALVPQGGGGG